MEEQKEVKAKPCYCTALLGALVVVFAWWQVRWAPVALTGIGVVVIFKTLCGCCCCSKICRDTACKPGK